jgi:glycosyltransferase involved in cell wall biosynthesis
MSTSLQSQPESPTSQASADGLKYVLITPARNEADLIEGTIKSVLSQTQLPVKWVIVSDGSTDGTDEIVKKYADQSGWIQLVRMPERAERNFAGKVYAFKAGQECLVDTAYDVIGNLDADLTFGPDHFEFLMERFVEDSNLGVAGTPFQDDSMQYDYRFASTEHVSGCCQLFRKECFEAIGGYRPNKTGGIDLVAVITARMKGWKTQSFLERHTVHHRKIGSANRYDGIRGAFKDGQRDYSFGCDPLWQLSRCIYRLFGRPPYLVGGSLCFAGFFWSMLTRAEIVVPPDFVTFRRTEERRRLRSIVGRVLLRRS